MRLLHYLLVSAAVLLLCSALPAQTTQPARHATLVTIGPGEEIFEQFSHNAIWIHDPEEQAQYRDVAFNYGLFSFEGDFIWRFVRGKMRYWMGGLDHGRMMQAYKEDNRSLWLQRLNLTDEQRQRLDRFLWTNATPENRYYTYNYYNDNCSTRVRDALDGVLGGQIKAQTASVMTGHTYRFHTRRILIVNPVIYIAVDFVAGPATDRELSRWDEMFLPQLLQAYLRDVRVETNAGEQPLVLEEDAAFIGTRPVVRQEPLTLLPVFTVTGLVTTGALLGLQTLRRRLIARVIRNGIIIGWTLLTAFAGATLAFFNIATDHWATYHNENLLQMPPIAMVTLLLLPWALRTRGGATRYPIACRAAGVLAILTFALSALGLVLKCLPIFRQQNWDFIAWILPVHAAIAMILSQTARAEAPGGQPERAMP